MFFICLIISAETNWHTNYTLNLLNLQYSTHQYVKYNNAEENMFNIIHHMLCLSEVRCTNTHAQRNSSLGKSVCYIMVKSMINTARKKTASNEKILIFKLEGKMNGDIVQLVCSL